MLTDGHGLLLSTTSTIARDAYVEGCGAKLTMYPGATEAFDRAIAADPRFALAHVARAHTLLEYGNAAAARESMTIANSFTAGLTDREASHVAFFDMLVSGNIEAARVALPVHLNAWPRDVLVVSTMAFTNGLVSSSGIVGQKRILLDMLEQLARHFGDDWWFLAHHGMALSENGCYDAARLKIDRSFTQNRDNPWAAHAMAHLCYEQGDPAAACGLLASWLTTYPREGLLYSHLNWHLTLGHLKAGDVKAASRVFREALAPSLHSGPSPEKLNDAVSFLWRWELAGYPRDTEAWRVMYDLTQGWFPPIGTALSDIHIALAQIVAGDHAALEARVQRSGELARSGRYPSRRCVPAVSRAFAAFERQDFAAVIDILGPIAGELECIGGSHAQLDLVRLTLSKAYLGAGPPDDGRQALSMRRTCASDAPVASLAEATLDATREPGSKRDIRETAASGREQINAGALLLRSQDTGHNT